MSYHQKGRTTIRDFLVGLFTHFHVAEDTTAFADNQTVANPGGGRFFADAVTVEDVDANTKRYKLTVTSESFGDVDIATLGLANGPANSDNLSRIVRTRTIGIEAENDSAVIAIDVETRNPPAA